MQRMMPTEYAGVAAAMTLGVAPMKRDETHNAMAKKVTASADLREWRRAG